MAIQEYRRKGGIVAYHFTDSCNCDEDLKKMGVKHYSICIKNYNGVERVTISILDDNKGCLMSGFLGDYIIRECYCGKLKFTAVPEERFEQDYELVGDIEIDDDCSNTSMKGLFERK